MMHITAHGGQRWTLNLPGCSRLASQEGQSDPLQLLKDQKMSHTVSSEQRMMHDLQVNDLQVNEAGMRQE